MVEVCDLQECLPQTPGEALGAVREAGREDLDERPLQPGCDGLGKGRLAGAGRTKQHDRARRVHAELLGQCGVGQRQDEPTLEQFLLGLHSRDGSPQVARQDAPAEIANDRHLALLHRDLPLEIAQVRAVLEPGLGERTELALLAGHEDGEFGQPLGGHALLESGEHRACDALATHGRGDREEDDPTLVVSSAGDSGAQHLLTVHRDDRVILLARRQYLGECVDRLDPLDSHLVPQAKDRIHI